MTVPVPDPGLEDVIRSAHRLNLTSNLHFDEWGDAFPNHLLDPPTLNQLRNGAYRITLEGESYRAPRPLPDTKKPAVARGAALLRNSFLGAIVVTAHRIRADQTTGMRSEAGNPSWAIRFSARQRTAASSR